MAARKHSPQPVHSKHAAKAAGDREPELMIQLPDPKMLRKEVLESLRDVIIFMQGYEKFRGIQEEKVALFLKLKGDIREITTLMDVKLRAHFPKGKLRLPVHAPPAQAAAPEPKIMAQAPSRAAQSAPAVPKQRDELAELEAQLRDIEGQLNGLH